MLKTPRYVQCFALPSPKKDREALEEELSFSEAKVLDTRMDGYLSERTCVFGTYKILCLNTHNERRNYYQSWNC